TVAGFAAERERDELRVVTVGDGGPADLAGLKSGDRILTIDGAPPPPRWPDAIARNPAGASVVLRVARGPRPILLRLTPPPAPPCAGTPPRPPRRRSPSCASSSSGPSRSDVAQR